MNRSLKMGLITAVITIMFADTVVHGYPYVSGYLQTFLRGIATLAVLPTALISGAFFMEFFMQYRQPEPQRTVTDFTSE